MANYWAAGSDDNDQQQSNWYKSSSTGSNNAYGGIGNDGAAVYGQQQQQWGSFDYYQSPTPAAVAPPPHVSFVDCIARVRSCRVHFSDRFDVSGDIVVLQHSTVNDSNVARLWWKRVYAIEIDGNRCWRWWCDEYVRR